MKSLFYLLAAIISMCVSLSVSADDELTEGDRLLQAESWGKLRLSQTEAEVRDLLGKPESVGKTELWEATGEYVTEWLYPKLGLRMNMAAEEEKGRKVMRDLTVEAPSKSATKAGIKIGSTAAELRAAYGRYEDKEASQSPATFVAGSVYGGLIFTLEKGKVVSVFFGAAAE